MFFFFFADLLFTHFSLCCTAFTFNVILVLQTVDTDIFITIKVPDLLNVRLVIRVSRRKNLQTGTTWPASSLCRRTNVAATGSSSSPSVSGRSLVITTTTRRSCLKRKCAPTFRLRTLQVGECGGFAGEAAVRPGQAELSQLLVLGAFGDPPRFQGDAFHQRPQVHTHTHWVEKVNP